MLRVLIVEDEEPAVDMLRSMLKRIRPDIEVLAVTESIQETTAWLTNHQADLIFLDVHLADGDSFTIFENQKINTPIIFVTAFNQYALQAFKLNSIAYLVKPVQENELRESLDKYAELYAERNLNEEYNSLLHTIQKKELVYQKRFMVSSGEKIRVVPIEEVAYFMGEDKYLFLFTKEGRKYIIDSTLTKMEDKLDPDRFFRINRKFIISLDAINNMFAYSKSRVKIELDPPLPDDLEAIVSVDRSPHFKLWLNR